MFVVSLLTLLSCPAGDVRVRGSRSRDDTELSTRNNRNMRRNHSLDPRSSRLSLGDFINNTTGLPSGFNRTKKKRSEERLGWGVWGVKVACLKINIGS